MPSLSSRPFLYTMPLDDAVPYLAAFSLTTNTIGFRSASGRPLNLHLLNPGTSRPHFLDRDTHDRLPLMNPLFGQTLAPTVKFFVPLDAN